MRATYHVFPLLFSSLWQDGGAFAMQTTQSACLLHVVLVAIVS